MTTMDIIGRIDDHVDAERRRLGIPGMALGIVRGSEVLDLRGFGVADSFRRSVTPQTPFAIGSITKSFTALAVMQLAEAGRIALDAPVQEYLPWFTLRDRAACAQITARHLLNQTSGLSTTDGNRFWNSTADMEGAVRQLRSVRLSHPVGEVWQYSNINYTILGLMVEQVSGQSYGVYLQERVFGPLQMRHSHWVREAARADGMSEGHYFLLRHAIPRQGVFPPAYLPTGLLICSVEDMTHYAIAHLQGGRYRNASVLSAAGVAELHAPAAGGSYAMGWMVNQTDGTRTIWHNGDAGIFHSAIILQPEGGWGIVLLANASGFQELLQVDHVARGVQDLLNDRAPQRATLPAPFRFLYWTTLLTPVALLAGITFTVLHWLSGNPNNVYRMFLPALASGMVGMLFLLGLSKIVPFPLSSMKTLYPELGYSAITSGILGIGFTAIYLLFRILWP